MVRALMESILQEEDARILKLMQEYADKSPSPPKVSSPVPSRPTAKPYSEASKGFLDRVEATVLALEKAQRELEKVQRELARLTTKE